MVNNIFKSRILHGLNFSAARKLLAGALILTLLAISAPMPTFAALGNGDTVIVVGDVSPTGISNFINHEMQHLKDFVLDHLATLIAKQILHQMTISVVNWINSGFKGSPAFLTNPEAFFLDAADQVTGAFLATDGPLSSLCSPFNIDIRLSLALSQTALSDQRYTCTVGQIIAAQSNGPNITVNGQVVHSAQTASVNGFLNGDFNQGGWPAFLAVTTEPQNNPYGADLDARISARQNTIHADLQLGNGFMSWQSCKAVPGFDHVDVTDEAGMSDSDLAAIQQPGVSQVTNSDGTATYQTCETQTPGSVIAGTLQKSLNVPADELELANDINAVINALVSQMVTQMLSGGLHALSGGSASGPSYTQQVVNDINSNNSAVQPSIGNMQSSISTALDGVNQYLSLYDQAISLIQDSQNRYQSAKACYINLLSSPSVSETVKMRYQGTPAEIDGKINNQVVPVLNNLDSARADAAGDQTELQNMSYSLSGTGSADQVQATANEYASFVQSGGLYSQNKISAAQTALTTAQTQSQTFNNDAAQYQKNCQSAPQY